MRETNRWHRRFVSRCFVHRQFVVETIDVGRGSPNQRGPFLAEAEKAVESTHLEPDPDFCDEPQSDEGPPP